MENFAVSSKRYTQFLFLFVILYHSKFIARLGFSHRKAHKLFFLPHLGTSLVCMLCIRSRYYSRRLRETEYRCIWPLMRLDSSRPGLYMLQSATEESYFSSQGRDFTHKSGDEEPRHASLPHRSVQVYASTFARLYGNDVSIKFPLFLESKDATVTLT